MKLELTHSLELNFFCKLECGGRHLAASRISTCCSRLAASHLPSSLTLASSFLFSHGDTAQLVKMTDMDVDQPMDDVDEGIKSDSDSPVLSVVSKAERRHCLQRFNFSMFVHFSRSLIRNLRALDLLGRSHR